MKTPATVFVLAVVSIFAALQAFAGEFFERDGFALGGYDPVAYFKENKPVKGAAQHGFVYRGSTFHFISAANRDAFAADPARYTPQYAGFCAFGVSNGYKAATDPAAFTVVNNKLYLNYNREVQGKWSSDIPGYVGKANARWPAVEPQTKVIQ